MANKWRLRDKIKTLLYLGDSPDRIALSFAVGTFIAISPLLGVQTVVGLVVAWFFRLNKVVVLTAVYITNPWTFIPIYAFCIWFGAFVLNVEIIIVSADIAKFTFSKMASEFKHLLMPYIVGTVLLGAVSSFSSYFIIKRVCLEIEKIMAQEIEEVQG